jgi:dTDP-4-dehydrorhamnose 3,5-epimerase-like enzyme
MNSLSMETRMIAGGVAVDDRGFLMFVNDFDFAGVKRFYIVANHEANFIRAWHGHRREGKYVLALSGSALVAAVKVDDWGTPSKDLEVTRVVLSDRKPAVLYIPPGFANGFKTLTPDARLMFLSTSTLEESMGDDIRFPADYWDPWEIVPR